MAKSRKICFDIEATGLLDDSTVDYTASPWVLRDTFKLHCIVAIDMNTQEVFHFVQDECYTKFPSWFEQEVACVVGHNIVQYDLLALKAACGMHYTVGPDTVQNLPVEIIDTLVLSKTLNPDRRGHSIEYFGELFGDPKIDWRAKAVELGLIDAHAPKGAEFRVYHPEMLVYNEQDVKVNIKAYHYLMKEWGDWPWAEAYELEKAVAEIITRQSHRGFWFDTDLAMRNVKELDELMAERKALVEPSLPEKPMGKTKLKEYTPGAKQFLKSGEPNSNIIKWCEKHGGTIEKVGEVYQTTLYGKTYTLPLPQEPIVTTEPSKIDDTTFIKGFLVEMGWQPTQYKERDLTVDTKKQKLSSERFKETVERYVEQTLSSPFCKDRCERVKATPSTLREKLLKHDLKKPLKVYTNPTLTVGQEKEIDPALVEMNSEFPHVQSIVEYLTYKHRRNSILGGGIDPDDWEEDDDMTAKGFLANVRSDGRIPTPADSCGAATGRMKHRVCCNIPRVTSLYGGNIRALFGVDPAEQFVQYAYDFSSLEACLEAHYCWKYDEDKSYCRSLLQEKPNDVHSVTARKITEMIGQAFGRTPAKSVKYASTYGAQAARIAKTVGCDLATGQKIYDAFWEAAKPLALLKEAVEKYWTTKGEKKFVIGLDRRKINTRSQHALLNSLFQSAGVICAKRVAVWIDKLSALHGINVDCWTEDWKTKESLKSMICMHDEQQQELSKSLVQWKRFETEDEKKLFMKENPRWSSVHSDRGIFAGHSLADEILFEAICKTNSHYKLNVPLATESMYGRNWCETH